MVEGWLEDTYLILFDNEEVQTVTSRYRLGEWLPDHQVIGLFGWDEFVVRDSKHRIFRVPTVPVDAEQLEPIELPQGPTLRPDPRYAGRIKWYVKPVAFGGDPSVGGNLEWVTHDKHVELVVWWNELYRNTENKQLKA